MSRRPDDIETEHVIETLELEVARLREALEQIAYAVPAAAMPWSHEAAADVYWAAFDRCRHTARAALEGKP